MMDGIYDEGKNQHGWHSSVLKGRAESWFQPGKVTWI